MKLFKASCIILLAFLVMVLSITQHFTQAAACGALASVAVAGWMMHASPSTPGMVHLNTLTNLIPDFYAALDVVSRELVGMIPAVQRDPSADRCALNATMRSAVTPTNGSVGDITPAMALPSAAYQTIGNRSFTIQKSRFAPFSWTGEEQYSVNGGPGSLTLAQDQIAQALRALTNEIETDLNLYGAKGASRAYGTAGTTPFASSLADTAQVRKILDDNGAPASGRSLVCNTSAGAALRTLAQLTKANEAGTSMTLRDGELLNLHGFSVKESAQTYNATAGTGSGYQINNASGYAIGDTDLTLDTGSGTILAGDIITIGSHKYVVASALAANVVTIAAPGLRAAVADNATVTLNATSARNLAFSQNAILLGTRLPAMPTGGDMADDIEIITDPRSGLVFELAAYKGFRMVTYHVSIAWGVAVMKPEHIAISLG